jgi:hypothetical protein
MSNTINDRIEHLRELLGSAVLLPWPARSKGNRTKWKHLKLNDMNDHGHLKKLEQAGNIGVALGEVSEGLVTIDIDDDKIVDRFLEANPLLKQTLRTRGSRGCNIWLRCSHEYPPSGQLRDLSDNKIGEWRADGNQTIVAGTHPTDVPYRFVVDKPVITINYNAIMWPNTILPLLATESKRVRGVIRIQRVGEKEVVGVCACTQIDTFLGHSDPIAQLAPKDYHQNNASLFNLARLVKSYENATGLPATEVELEFVFDRWSLIARLFWRTELTRDDYYAEFLEAYGYARIGLDENPIEIAFNRANSAQLPQLRGFTDERVRLLVAICREMQVLTGDRPFFVPTRKLGDLLGVDHSRVARWLRALQASDVIYLAPGEIRRRGGNRSPRYYYGTCVHKTDALVVTPPLIPSASTFLTNGTKSNPHAGETDCHSDEATWNDVGSVCGGVYGRI